MLKIFISILSLIMLLTDSTVLALTDPEEGFEDVSLYHDYSLAIDYLKENDIVNGYQDGTYKPDNTISRGEFAKIVVGAIASTEDIKKYEDVSCFSDVSILDPLHPYICYAKENKIINGFSDEIYGPSLPISFHEASKILLLSFDFDLGEMTDDWYDKVLLKMSELKDIPPTINEFNEKITRGEMAELVLRIKEESDEYISKDYNSESDKIVDQISTIDSCEALKEKLNDLDVSYPMALMERDSLGATNEQALSDSSKESASDFSMTNVQVEGVDESDVIKNDGKYIYMVREDKVTIVNAYPANNLSAISTIDFSKDDFYPNELYLSDGKLVVLGTTYYQSSQNIAPYESLDYIRPYFYSSMATVKIYNIESIKSPVLERTVSFKGDLRSSRKIGDYLYGVVTTYPEYRVLSEEGYSVDDIMPIMSDSSKSADEFKVANCSDVKLMPPLTSSSFMTIFSLSLEDVERDIDKEVILGNAENIYASKDNLYVISTHYDYQYYPISTFKASNSNTERTIINKFQLDKGVINYEGSSKVPGRTLNQFSMDEYSDNFRIATTTGNMWSFDEATLSSNNMYVLDDNLDVTGKIEGIAKGEQIYSTRFMGKRAYMVTFKNTDPLFAIDLSDPKAPKILGKLKIPGYSNYLHPYDENHIIGFGKDAVEVTGEDKETMGNFAWYQGMKIAIFDVTDIENPKEMFTELIGDRGTQSELLYNHKALLFDKSKGLLSFPISVAKVPDGSSSDTYGETVFNGAYVYDIDLVNGFKLRDKKTHYDSTEEFQASGDYFYGDYGLNIQRIIYIGEDLYTISQNMVKAYELDSLKDISKVTLN